MTAEHKNRLEGGFRDRKHFPLKSGTGNPLVTVVTIVFNGAQHLEHTILSVLGQTYDNIEYIIIDGGSGDGTLDIIRRYDDKLAYWVSEPDKGIYDAMNKGIDLASGDWINFMNAGDRFYQANTIERVMSSDRGTADLIFGDCQMVYDPEFSLIWKAKSLDALWKGMIFRHQSLFTRASVCKKIHFSLDYRIGADFAFIFSCYQHKLRFAGIDLVISSVSAEGLSDSNIILALIETRRAVVQYNNTLRVNIYYWWFIFLTRAKIVVKKLLPAAITNLVRSLKHR